MLAQYHLCTERRIGMRLKIEKINEVGTSLVVQWLRLKFLMPGTWVHSLTGELRSHMLCSMAKITTTTI